MDSDKVLYDKFLQGDHTALEELIGIYKESLTLFLYGYLNNMAEAEDMMIDVFAQLVCSAGKFREHSTLKTYLFAIGRNEALRYLKKHKQHLALDEISEDALCDEAVSEFALLQQEYHRQLYHCMRKLHAEYRDILLLLYFENMSYKDAARVMKKSEKQITNLAYRAKKSLKIALEQEGFSYDAK